jgi:hypothetical protein
MNATMQQPASSIKGRITIGSSKHLGKIRMNDKKSSKYLKLIAFSLATLNLLSINCYARLREWREAPDVNTSTTKPTATVVPAPKISLPSSFIKGHDQLGIAFSEISKNLQKKIVFDPYIAVNENTGALKTSFSIPLPPHLLSFKSLNFSYNSLFFQNNNLGIGWSWNIPTIKEKNFRGTMQYYTGGLLGSTKLNETSYDISTLPKRIYHYIKKSDSFEYRVFKKSIYSDSSLFIKIQKKAGQKHQGWIVLSSKTGEAWVFNSKNRVTQLINIRNKKLTFSYDENDLLRSIHYKNLWKFNLLFSTGQLLTSLSIETQPLSKQIDFKYDGDYLTLVKRKEGKIPFFQGVYSSIKGKLSSKTIEDLKKENNGIQNLIYNVDLNGDALKDRVSFHTKDFTDSVSNILKGFEYWIHPGTTCKWAYPVYGKARGHNKIVAGEPFARYMNKHTRKSVSFHLREPSGNLKHIQVYSKDSREYFPILANYSFHKGKDPQCSDWVDYPAIHFTSRPQFFVDLNNDGLKDLV